MTVKAFNQAFGGNPNSRNYRPGEDAVLSREGGLAYKLNELEAVTQLVMLGLIKSSFYCAEAEQLTHSKEVWEQVIKLAERDEDTACYLAQLVSYGREMGGMKFQPTLGLVYLSTLSNKRWFRLAFPHVIKTPKDAFDFMELARKANIRKGLGRAVKRELNDYLCKLRTYHVRRYAGKLRDIVSVVRPATASGTIADMHLGFIMKGNPGDIGELYDLQKVRECLQKGIVDGEVLALIQEHGMQLEELKSYFGTISDDQRREVFKAMIPGLSIMSLIQNLVTIERTFSGDKSTLDCMYLTPEIIWMVRSRLGDVEAFRWSRMLPFTPMIAAKATHVPEWKTALETLVDEGCKAMLDPEKVKGKSIRINVDTSGSMQGRIVAGNERKGGPTVNIAEFVGVMGSALYQAMPENCSIWAIASNYKRVPVRTLSASKLGKAIMNTPVGHGTYFEQCMTGNVATGAPTWDFRTGQEVVTSWKHVPEAAYQGEDVYILLTDGMQADNLEKAWAEAKKPEGARLIIWDVEALGTRISRRPDVVYLRGYSAEMLGVVRQILETGADQIAQIREYRI